MIRKIIEIVIAGLVGYAGYYKASLSGGPFDGPCSGVWRQIETYCLYDDAWPGLLAVIFPSILFYYRKSAAFISFLTIFSFALYTSINYEWLYFTKHYYVPSILGIWVTLWAALAGLVFICVIDKVFDVINFKFPYNKSIQ